MMQKVLEVLKIHRWPLSILLLTWGTYFFSLFPRVFVERPDGIYATPAVWSDWSLHLGMVRNFAENHPSEWFLHHPQFSGAPLHYPFLTNFISGILVRLGLSVPASMILPSLAFSFFLLLGLYALGVAMLSSGKRALLGISIFFFTAGTGFVYLAKDLLADFSWDGLIFPRQEFFTHPQYQWFAGNIIHAFLIPQRAFLLGMTLGVWALAALLTAIQSQNLGRARLMLVGAGVSIGLLPITHMHTLLAMLPFLFLCLWIYRERLSLLLFAILPAVVLGGVLYFLFLRDVNGQRFFTWTPGWTSGGNIFAWLKMWIEIWGVVLPFLIVIFWMLLRRNRGAPALKIGMAFLFSFLLANLFLYQPVAWDNTKVFLWCYLIFSFVMAGALADLWSRGRWQRALGVTLTFVLTISGVFELIKLQQTARQSHRMISRDFMDFAEDVRRNTSAEDVFLTAPVHNHWAMMWSARPVFLGYEAWVVNYGFPFHELKADLRKIYDASREMESLVQKHKIRFVVFGDEEKRAGLDSSLDYFQCRFKLAFERPGVLVFDLKTEINPGCIRSSF